MVEVVSENPGTLLLAGGTWMSPRETDTKGYHIISGGASADQPGFLILYFGRVPGVPIMSLVFGLVADSIPGIFSVALPFWQVIPMPFVSVGFLNTGVVQQTSFDLYIEARNTS